MGQELEAQPPLGVSVGLKLLLSVGPDGHVLCRQHAADNRHVVTDDLPAQRRLEADCDTPYR